MNSNYALNLLRSIVLNNTMSFSLILLTWVAAVLTSSFALLSIAALMTYGHPTLHSILLNPAEVVCVKLCKKVVWYLVDPLRCR